MKDTIHVGSDAEYKEIYSRGAFAVFSKTLGPIVSFIIAKIPATVRTGDLPAVPTSVLQEYSSEVGATLALNRWADAPPEVPLPKPRKNAIASCKHVERPKLKRIGPGQLDLSLSD